MSVGSPLIFSLGSSPTERGDAMASGYAVELSALQRLNKDLKTCTDEMDHALKALEEIGPKGLGYDFLDEACAHYQDKWDNGLSRISEIAEDLKDKIDHIGKNYAKAESGVIDALKDVGSGEMYG
ncbi:hypothetical protein HCC61_09530 [Streptomyces sp. HNM0575]|nr:hypothetical protein [Streptomyces sp. HNM0575]